MSFTLEPTVAAPYPGLRPFLREESQVFFGRDQQIDEVLTRLKRHQFLGVVGSSGCGKSSLIRAGILPALEAGLMGEIGSTWYVADMKPGDAPLTNLANGLIKSGVLGPRWSGAPEAIAMLTAALRRSDISLVDLIRQVHLPKYTNLLVLADQFEEVFRLQQRDPNEAMAFVNLLLTSGRDRSVPIYVVLTMRTDYLGTCALFPGLPEALNDAQYLCPRLTRDQLAEAIEGPAAVFGRRVERGLITQIINDAGANSDQLPLVQHALSRIWNRLTGQQQSHIKRAMRLEDYHSVGGLNGIPAQEVTPTGPQSLTSRQVLDFPIFEQLRDLNTRRSSAPNALSQHADEAYFDLHDDTMASTSCGPDHKPSRKQMIAQMLFRCLAERGPSGQYVRRPVKVRDVAVVASCSNDEMIEVVENFRREDRCFLVPPFGVTLTAESVLDISHEALIRQWGRFGGQVELVSEHESAQSWLQIEEQSRRRYRRLAEAAENETTAGLLRNPELEFLNLWWREFRPSPAWANSCLKASYDQSDQFLKRSLAQAAQEENVRQAEQSSKLAAAQKRTREAQRWTIAVLAVAVVAVCSLFFAWQTNSRLKSQAIELAHTYADLEIKKNEATQLAERLKAVETYVDNNPEHSKRIAMSYDNPTKAAVQDSWEWPSTTKFWGAGERAISVGFLDGDPVQHSLVQEVAQEWTQDAGITFNFLPYNDPTSAGKVRISFLGSGDWSFLGTDCLSIPGTRPTMNLGSVPKVSDELARATILREFGHMLGLFSEHMNPNANIHWNEDAVFLFYEKQGWSKEMVRTQLFSTYPPDQFYNKPFDPNSIMMNPVPALLTTDGFHVGQNTHLSEGDREFIRKIYPKPR